MRAVVIASDQPIPGDLAGRALPLRNQTALEGLAVEFAYHLHRDEDRAYLIDTRLTGVEQSNRLVQLLKAAREAPNEDASRPYDDPAVRPYADQAFGPPSMALEGRNEGRFAVVPVERVWLTDGSKWVLVEPTHSLSPATRAGLSRKPLRADPDANLDVSGAEARTVDVHPISAVHLMASGWQAPSPRQRALDLKVVSEFVFARLEESRALVADALASLVQRSPSQRGGTPAVGTRASELEGQWRAVAMHEIDRVLANLPASEREAFLRHASVASNLIIVYLVTVGPGDAVMMVEIGTP